MHRPTHCDQRDDDGHAFVVRNGRARSRKVVTGTGVLDVEAWRVNDRRHDMERSDIDLRGSESQAWFALPRIT